MPANGGEPGLLTRPDTSRGEAAHWWPQFLPDGRRFLFQGYGTRAEGSGVFLASLDAPDERRRLLPASVRARHGAGHLLFPREGTLVAQPFDADRAELPGEPVPIAFDVAIGGAGNLAHFSGPTRGLLAFFVGGASDWALEWLDREGTRLGAVGDPDRTARSPSRRTRSTSRSRRLRTKAGRRTSGRSSWIVESRPG